MKTPIVVCSIVLSSGLLFAVGGGQQPSEQSLKTLKAAPGLEATLWASEPDLTNPTNMAIDERGRIWVTEAVNYRRALRKVPDIRPEGDRIVILDDVNHDGHADEVKVFDQSPEIRSPLGIAGRPRRPQGGP